MKDRPQGLLRLRRPALPAMETFEPRRLLAVTPVAVAEDKGYGDDGRLVVDLREGPAAPEDTLWEAVPLPAGGFVMAGSSDHDGAIPTDAVLVRYGADGTPDRSFGQGGVSRFLPAGWVSGRWYTALGLPGGKIVAAGALDSVRDEQPFQEPIVARFNADGSPDTTFGPEGAGFVRLNTERAGWAQALDVLGDGRIIVGGRLDLNEFTGDDAALWRLSAEGTLDTSFGADGQVVQNFNPTNGADGIDALAANPDGSFFGATVLNGVRLFGADGVERAAVTTEGVSEISRDPSGKLVVAGIQRDFHIHVIRVLPDGRPDPAFHEAVVDFHTDNDKLSAVLVRPDGSVLVAGGNGYAILVARLRPDGTRDETFGPSGATPVMTLSHWGMRALVPGAGNGVFAAGYDSTRAPGDDFISENFITTRIVVDPPLSLGATQDYIPDEGGIAKLTAEASYAGGTIETYEWGMYFGSDFVTVGTGPTLDWPVANHDGTAIMLRVTTSDGLRAASGMIPVLARNLPPAIDSLTAPSFVPFGVPAVTVSGSVVDPGGDPRKLSVDYGDGRQIVDLDLPADGRFNLAHIYAARGTYTVKLTPADDDGAIGPTREVTVRAVQVTGKLFRDVNEDGRAGAEDLPFVGVTVFVDLDGDGVLDGDEPQTLSNSSGEYAFDALDKGTFPVRVVPPAGWRGTSDFLNTPVVINDTTGSRRDFGLTNNARITGAIFNDANLNGVRDPGETAPSPSLLPALFLDLDNDGYFDAGEPVAGPDRGVSGGYAFSNLDLGTYTVRLLTGLNQPTGEREYLQTAPGPVGGHTGYTVTVGPGQIAGGNDFGAYHSTLWLNGSVYEDHDRDGTRDNDELFLPNRYVYVDANDNGRLDPDETRVPTQSSGGFLLPVLPGRQYTLRPVVPEGWTQSEPAAGGAQVVTVDAAGTVPAPVRFGLYPTALPAVVGRHLFYYRSVFAPNTLPTHAENDAAIAPDKVALLPGEQASAANVTSYSRGLNGIMVDVRGLQEMLFNPSASSLLRFAVGSGANPAAATSWTPINPSGFGFRDGGGENGSDRLVATFADNAIGNQWLQVTVLANRVTGLSRPEVFYFGHLGGETGDAGSPLRVGALDVAAVKRALNTSATPDSRVDLNRDGRVNALDVALVKQNLGRSLVAMIAPAPAAPSAALKVERLWREEA